MRKSTMFQKTVVLAAMLAGTVAFASMLEEEEASPPKWTIANPGDAETINAHKPHASIKYPFRVQHRVIWFFARRNVATKPIQFFFAVIKLKNL